MDKRRKTYEPAKGLKLLTWEQVTLIDALACTAAEMTNSGGETELIMRFERGHPTKIFIPQIIKWARSVLKLNPT